jgi:hypothetical protein
MSVVKILVAAVLSLGLGVPSAHSIAVCVDESGNIAIEAALASGCAGSRAADQTPGGGSEGSLGRLDHGTEHCGACRDVVISRDNLGSPLKHTKVRRQSPDHNSFPACVAALSEGAEPGSLTTMHPTISGARQLALDRTVVLLL